MKLINVYNQSISSVIATGAELNFNWKNIIKTKPHHKFLIRPSLVIANYLGTDINNQNNQFRLNGITYTIPNGFYTIATLATALTALTTPQLWSSLSSNNLQLLGFSSSRIFTSTPNSAHQVMGYVVGFNYSGTGPALTYTVKLAPSGYLYLNYPNMTSKTGNQNDARQQDGNILKDNKQGRYQIATLISNGTTTAGIHFSEEDACNNEGLLIDEMPLKPFSITMENENGQLMTGANRIEYNILFTIMEVDCSDKPKPITNRIVANYIRCLSYANQTATFPDFTSTSFLNGLVKKNPKNKWFVVCGLAITNGGQGSGRFAQILHPSFTSKCGWYLGTGGAIYNRYFISMPSASGGTPTNMTNIGNGLLIDDFYSIPLNVIVGQNVSISGVFNFYSVFNIYEIEYI